jgi:hypothetical protein
MQLNGHSFNSCVKLQQDKEHSADFMKLLKRHHLVHFFHEQVSPNKLAYIYMNIFLNIPMYYNYKYSLIFYKSNSTIHI